MLIKSISNRGVVSKKHIQHCIYVAVVRKCRLARSGTYSPLSTAVNCANNGRFLENVCCCKLIEKNLITKKEKFRHQSATLNERILSSLIKQ